MSNAISSVPTIGSSSLIVSDEDLGREIVLSGMIPEDVVTVVQIGNGDLIVPVVTPDSLYYGFVIGDYKFQGDYKYSRISYIEDGKDIGDGAVYLVRDLQEKGNAERRDLLSLLFSRYPSCVICADRE